MPVIGDLLLSPFVIGEGEEESGTLTETADRLYSQLQPTFFMEDGRFGFAGRSFVKAFCHMFDPAAEIVQPLGSDPGFAILFDPVRVPSAWLPWLGQFVGIPVEAIQTLILTGRTDVARLWIKQPIGYSRGKDAAMVLAAQSTLTGTKTVFFYPRYNGEPFSIKAATLASQTPSAAVTREAIESVMPAWDVLKYETVSGGTVAILEASHPLLSEIEAAHTIIEDVELQPEL